MVFMLAAFVSGEIYSMGYGRYAIIGMGILFFLMGRHKRYLSSYLRIAVGALALILFFWGGIIRMRAENAPDLLQTFSETNTLVRAQGRISRLSKTAYSYSVYLKDVEVMEGEDWIAASPIWILLSDISELEIGNYIRVSGKFAEQIGARNPGEFDWENYNRALGFRYRMNAETVEKIDAAVQPFGQALHAGKQRMLAILRAITTDSDYGIYAAMLLGEKSELKEETRKLYSENGISHILAISGQHIGLIGMTLYGLLRIRLSRAYAGGVSSGILFLYLLLIGMSPSAMRAWLMFSMMLVAPCMRRTYDMLSAACMAALIMLWDSPYLLTYSGFLLSFFAVFGIGVLGGLFWEYVKPKNPAQKGFLSSLAVQWMITPLTSYSYFFFYPYGILLNLFVLPCAGTVIVSGFIGILCGNFSILLGKFWIGTGHYLLRFYEILCRICEMFPFHEILTGRPSILNMIGYYGAIGCICFLIWKKQKNQQEERKERTQIQKNHFDFLFRARITTLIFLSCCLMGVLIWNSSKELSVTFLDVSQGDGIFIQIPSSATILIDGGSSDIKKLGQYRLLPFLRSKKVAAITYAIITHADADHINGLSDLLRSGEIRIEHLLLPQIGNPDSSYQNLIELARKNGVVVQAIQKGTVITAGDARIECYYPYAGIIREDRNDASTVLRLSYGEADFCFTGDLGSEGEQYLAEHGMESCEILKVAHHGSRYSSGESFLKMIRPQIAIISCGAKNSYGHPHEEVLERFHTCGAEVFTTMDHGAITVTSDGRSCKVKGYLDGDIPILEGICYTD